MLPEPPNLTTSHQTSRKTVKKISLQSLYWTVGCWVLLVGFYILDAYTYLMSNRGDIESFSRVTMNIFFAIAVYSVLLLFAIRRLVGLRILERRRRNIAPDSPVRLAAVQPQPNNVPLQAPLIIDQCINWAYFLKDVCYIIIVIIAVYTFSIAVEYLLWKNIYLDAFTWSIFAILILIMLIIIAFATKSSAKEQLIAMENGLLKKTSGKEVFIFWHEVRLFAIDNMDINNNKSTSILTFGKHNEPTFFELSSEQVILQWQRLHPPRWYELTVAQPVVGYEAYNQQMQALLSIIVAKTGLPLYDLR